MRRRAILMLVAAGLLGSGACRREAAGPPPGNPASSDGRIEVLLRTFASAIVARNYPSAYEAVAAERRPSLSLQELEEAFGYYRDGLPDGLQTEVRIDPYDPDSATLVPDEFHDRIVAEGVIYFEPGDEDLEGFSAIMWIVMEGGEPRVASFYVGD